MTADDFTTAAHAEAERRHPAPEIETGVQLGYTQTQIREVVRRTFAGAAEWARAHLAAQEPLLFDQILAVMPEGARRHWEYGEQDREKHRDRGCSCDLCQTLIAVREAR